MQDVHAPADQPSAQPARPAKPAKPAAAKGAAAEPDGSLETTVFVRGLPLDVTQEQLRQALRPHGPIKSCR